jgi:hypothetical protein
VGSWVEYYIYKIIISYNNNNTKTLRIIPNDDNIVAVMILNYINLFVAYKLT